MHSQQTFNECIAQAEGVLAGQGDPRRGRAAEKREQQLRPHVFIFQLNDSVSTYFPAADSQEELQNIALLLLLKLLDVCSIISSVACSEAVGRGCAGQVDEMVRRTLKGTHGCCKIHKNKRSVNSPRRYLGLSISSGGDSPELGSWR